jgi:TolA-binding protein
MSLKSPLRKIAMGSALLIPFLSYTFKSVALAEETKASVTKKKKKKAVEQVPDADEQKLEKAEATKKDTARTEALPPSTSFQADKTPQQAMSNQLKSVEGEQINSSKIVGVSQADLLETKGGSAPKGGLAKVESSGESMQNLKKMVNGLSLGVYRSQSLSDGQVSAPGVADFAAYFRATTGSKPLPGQKAPAGNEAGKDSAQLGSSSKAELSAQAQAEQIRAQTADSIKKILLTKPNPDQRFELMMRYAEIQSERHAYLLEAEIANFNEIHDKWILTRKGQEPVFKTDNSSAQLLLGIDSLRAAVTQFPNHARSPEALFSLGMMLTQMQSDSAALYFERLISRFPKSEFIADSQLALGEFHFSKQKPDKALEHYQKVLAFKGTRAYNYAVYKLGWTYFNLRGKTQEDANKSLGKSLAAFKLVVKLSESAPTDQVLKDLRKEALKDMVLVFADLKDIPGAQKYFDSLNEPQLYFTLLERLAWMHSEAGEFADAVLIYEKLIAEGPSHERLPVFYAKIPELLEKQNKRKELLKTLASMSSSLSPSGAWMQKYATNKDVTESRNKTLSRELRRWAEKFHLDAQKNKRDNLLDDALVAYTLYLDNFGNEPESYKAHFFKGEILVQKQKFMEASDEYMMAVRLDEKHTLKGQYTKDALTNALACVDSVLSKQPVPKLPEPGKAPDKIPLPNLHQRLVFAIDTFVRLYPTDDRHLELGHRAASIVYAFGDYESANVRWTALAQKFPKSKEVYDGARLIVKVHVERQEWLKSIVETRKFIGIPGVKGTKLGQELEGVLRASIFQQALLLEKQEKRAEAADMFSAYHKEFQTADDAPKALFNAANNKFRLGKMDDAISVLRTLLAQYPKHDLVLNAHYLIASSYDALGQFSESAQSYEQLANDAPRSKVAPDSLLRASVQRLAIGDSEKAGRDAQSFMDRYPQHERVGEAWQTLGKSQARQKGFSVAAKTYMEGGNAMRKSKPSLAVLLYSLSCESALKQKDMAMAETSCNTGLQALNAVPAQQRDGSTIEGARLLGVSQVAILDAKLVDVYKAKVTDGMKLTEQFTKIKDSVQKLAGRYVEVAKLGNAEAGIAALYRVAEMQEFLGTVLLQASVPAQAKAEEIEQFKGTLERIALPLQEEATNLYLTAWQRAQETEAITPFTKKLYDKLIMLRPGEFRVVVEDMPRSGYFSSEVAVTKETQRIVKN